MLYFIGAKEMRKTRENSLMFGDFGNGRSLEAL